MAELVRIRSKHSGPYYLANGVRLDPGECVAVDLDVALKSQHHIATDDNPLGILEVVDESEAKPKGEKPKPPKGEKPKPKGEEPKPLSFDGRIEGE